MGHLHRVELVVLVAFRATGQRHINVPDTSLICGIMRFGFPSFAPRVNAAIGTGCTIVGHVYSYCMSTSERGKTYEDNIDKRHAP
jgi:hypothetical protein